MKLPPKNLFYKKDTVDYIDDVYKKIYNNTHYKSNFDKIKLSYLYKKSDEYALALTLYKIQQKKLQLTDVNDTDLNKYIFRLLNHRLYFDKKHNKRYFTLS